MHANEEKLRRNKRFLLLIFAVCAAPFVAAWAMYFLWQPQARMNYGDLISTPLDADPELNRIGGGTFKLSQLRGKWLLLHIDSGNCAEKCRQKLHFMRQLRLAQGKNQGRIERVWLLTDNSAPEASLLREYPEVYMLSGAKDFLARFQPAGKTDGHIYVVDPLGNLILRFPENPEPKGMIKDITRLLSVSRIG